MSKKQEVTKLLKAESDRVKTVELHPKEPLVICSLYSGQVTLWNYETQTLLKSFEIVDLPVRCVKFITRLQSFVCGADDMNIRVYNYNTMEKTATFEAHMDYIRCLAVHDTLPLLLTSSDDMTVKMFDWSKNWACTMTFEGHGHYVMCVTFNPKDPATFATASLDELIMVWNIHTPQRNFSLEGHEGGVNCVEYYPGGDKPYLISGSDDSTVRVWDYQTKACIQVLSAHNHNVSCVAFHPDLPLVFTGSEDENLCTFSTQTWRLESTVGYNMGRAWYISVKPKCNKVALAFDKGLLVLKVGKEDPVMSMDPKGTIFFAQTNEIVKLDVKSGLDKDLTDGELIQLPSKEVGTSEGIPRKILHGPGGQYVAVVMDDDEYIVNSALGWRSKCFGHAIAFVWGAGNGTFAILENSYTLKTFKQFKLKDTVKLEGSADSLFAGPALGVRIDNNVYFYDWETLRIIRQVTENPNEVVWSDSGELCALVTDNAAFILKYHPDDVAAALASGAPIEEDGLDCAFDLVEEIPVKMRRALWVGDCLLYVNRSDRICYYIGGETTSLAVMQRGFSLLGYVAKENRLYCMDKERNITSYQLHTDVIDFKTHIVREDMTAAMEILPRIPESMRQKVAEFLQARGHIKLAMEVTTDLDHRFDLAIQLGELGVALGIVQEKPTQAKWKQVGDIALELAHFDIAVSALRAAHDYNGLLLFYTSTGDVEAVLQLGREAQAQGRTSIAFTCFLYAQDHEAVIDLLMAAQRYAEAAFHARTYAQHRICEVVDKWRVQMAGVPRIRDALADPVAYPNLFPTVDLNTYEEPAEEEDGVDRPTPGEPFSPQNSVVEPPQGYVPVAAPTSPPKSEVAPSPPQSAERHVDPLSSPPAPVASTSSPKQPSPDKPAAGSPPKAEGGDEIDDIFDDEGTGAEDSAHTAGATAQPLRDEDLERMFEDEE